MSDLKRFEELSEPFKALVSNRELVYQLLDILPIPIQIHAPDGICIFTNKATLELSGVKDANLLVGHYNLKYDQATVAIMGQDKIDRALSGEYESHYDFPAPIQDVYDRGILEEKPWEAATMDVFSYPIWDGDTFAYAVIIFDVKNKYKGRTDMAKAREYIETHWQDELKVDEVAGLVNLSQRHFRRIFTEIVGETPQGFYQRIKVEKLMEKLLDGNLTVEQAFEACGVKYTGKTYLSLFKEKTGCTPYEYRKANMKK